jgi:AcrR family transcriptional regulator
MQTRKDEVRERILEAALDLFADRGYRGASIPDIARASGTAVGNLYRYFPSKEALLAAALPDDRVARIEELAMAKLRALAASGSRFGPGADARASAADQASGLGKYPRELRFLFKGAALSPREMFAARLASKLAEAYRAWARSIGAPPPRSAMPLIEALYASMLALAADAFQGGPDDLGRVIEYHTAGMAAIAEGWRKR